MHLILRLRGGGCAPTNFVDVSNEAAYQDRGFSASAPDWRAVQPGLNLRGTCTHPDCPAFSREVICPVFGAMFDLVLDADRAKCPMCSERVEPAGCGFTGCCYTFEGKKVTHRGLESYAKDAPERVFDVYRHFDPQSGGVAQWRSLKIIVKLDGTLPALSSVCFVCRQSQSEATPDSQALETTSCGHAFHAECRGQLPPEL